MGGPPCAFGKLKIELGHPFAGLVGLESVQNDIVNCRRLTCEDVVDRPRAIKVLAQVETFRWLYFHSYGWSVSDETESIDRI